MVIAWEAQQVVRAKVCMAVAGGSRAGWGGSRAVGKACAQRAVQCRWWGRWGLGGVVAGGWEGWGQVGWEKVGEGNGVVGCRTNAGGSARAGGGGKGKGKAGYRSSPASQSLKHATQEPWDPGWREGGVLHSELPTAQRTT